MQSMSAGTIQNAIRDASLLRAGNETDARAWEALVDNAPVPDVYYRPGYARAYEAIGHGLAVAIVIETDGARALFPLLLRPLSTLPFVSGEPGYDAASPYGYGGVALLDKERVTVEQASALLDGFRQWCRENQVVSAHIRLHPVLRQDEWFAASGNELRVLATTTALDLSRWNAESDCIGTMNKGRRSDLNSARRALRITWTTDGRDLSADLRMFHALYEQRMAELEAGGYYHFDFPYYEALARGLGNRFDVAVAWRGEEPAGAAIFMTDRRMSHYHLSATNDIGRSHKANTLILNAAAERARQLGCRTLHLGGGAHGQDKLLAFKQSFGGENHRYAVLNLICDADRYSRLLRLRSEAINLPALRPDFFPEFRA